MQSHFPERFQVVLHSSTAKMAAVRNQRRKTEGLKKSPFFLSFTHSSSKYDDCIPHVYCKKNKRAHILHLFTHCVLSHHRSPQIANYCLMPLIPSRTCPVRLLQCYYFSTLTTLTQFTAFTAHFSSLQRTTTTNANTTRQQVPAPSLLLICHTLYQR